MGWGKEHSPHLLPCLPRGPSPPDQWLRQHLRPLQVRGQTPQRRGLQDRSSGTPGGRGVPSWPPPAPGGTCAPWPVPPHPASDSFCGPRGSLSQGPAWGQLDLRGLHVVPPAVSSLGGGGPPRLRFLGLRTGSLSWAGFCHPWGLLPVQSGPCVETTGCCLLGHPEVEGLDQLPGTVGLRPPAAPSGGPCVPGAHAPPGASGLLAGHQAECLDRK